MSIGGFMWRMCHGKQRYETREAAQQRADHANRARGKRAKPLEAYRCDVCGLHHVGARRHGGKQIRQGGV